MRSITEVNVSIMTILAIVIIFEIFYIYQKDTSEKDDPYLMIEDDKPLTKKEIKHILEYHVDKKKNRSDITSLAKSMSNGAVRGFITGTIIGGFEGGAVTGLVFALVNPVLNIFESSVL